MTGRALQFEDAPAFSVGVQYFLMAPVFASTAGLLLAFLGGGVFASRFTPGALALAHLLTVGALAMAMAGALWQILPVVAGATVPRQDLFAAIVHRCLLAGAPLLALAFLSGCTPWFAIASFFLGFGLGTLVIGSAFALWHSGDRQASGIGIRCAMAALAVTLVLGLAMAGHWLGWWSIDLLLLVDLHASWGLAGWIGLLVLAVGLQVIPMFQVTPSYPAPFASLAAPCILVLLVAHSIAAIFRGAYVAALARLIEYGLGLAFLSFACVSLILLARRKRPKPDIGTLYWRLAFTCLMVACVLQLSGVAKEEPWRDCCLGVLYLAGFALSAIYGMLYRIVPFLAWYHLQTNAKPHEARLPSVRDMLNERAAIRQFRLHLVAIVVLAISPLWPDQSRVAGLLLAGSGLWLFALLRRVANIYRQWAP